MSIYDAVRKYIGKLPFIEPLLAVWAKGQHPRAFLSFYVLPRIYLYTPTDYRDVRRDGVRFRLYPNELVDYFLYFQLDVEPRQILYAFIKPDSVVLDIGTNIGETLLNFAKRCPQGFVHGFEPIPFLYERALHNIRLNPFTHLQLNNIALSNTSDPLSIGGADRYNSGSTFLLKSDSAEKTILAKTLDNYVIEQNMSRLDFIKMDVEGFEINVLIGAVQTFARFKPILFTEIDDLFLKRQGQSAAELVKLLENWGYQITKARTQESVRATDDFSNCHFDIICQANTEGSNFEPI